MHELKPLPYPSDALEPFIDKETMELHHGKHHKTYVDKLNAALEGNPELQNKSAEELVKMLPSVPEKIRGAVRNHGGGHANHTFFWQILKKDTKPHGEVAKAIDAKFGSFDGFKKEFTDKALALFGSGWTWLVLKNGSLELVNTPNQDSPLTDGATPVLGVDVWEHAYYVKYRNRRPEYVEAFFHVINWDKVEENFKNGTAHK
jgi:superoxide dismutase, Fe-Mn family